MPISLLCGACDAALTAPDAAAGKRVKCKKCGAILEVPLPEPDADFEVVEEAPTMMLPPIKKVPPPPSANAPPPAAAKPKPKPVMLEVDDENDEDDRPAPKKKPKPVMLDDEDEDDRPAPKKKPAKKLAIVEDDDDEDDIDDEPRPKKGKKKGNAKKKAAGSNLPLLIGGGVLGIAVAGFLVWFLAIRESESAKAPTPNPSNSQPMPGTPGPGMPAPGMPGPGTPGQPPAVPGVPPGMPPGPGTPRQPPAGWGLLKGDDFTTWVNASGHVSKSSLVAPAGGPTGATYANFTKNPTGFQSVSSDSLHPAARAAVQRDLNKYLEDYFISRVEGADLKKSFLSRTDSKLDGKPARDAIIKSPDRITFCRGAVVGDRLYLLTAYADNVTDVNDDFVRLFFNNFKFTGK